MRKIVAVGVGLMGVALLSGCGKRGYDRARPDEFAVARQAPLVIPPDFSLQPPQPGTAQAPTTNANAQTLEALFGAASGRTAGETATVTAAGGESVDAGARSTAGDPGTNVVDKGATTRDIVAAPEGDGQDARATTPQ